MNNEDKLSQCVDVTLLLHDTALINSGFMLDKPSTFANAFVNSRPFVTSNIIGATTIEQLHENIDSINIKLNDEILEEINQVHELMPNPAP